MSADSELNENIKVYFESSSEPLIIDAFWSSVETLNLSTTSHDKVTHYSIIACANLRDNDFSKRDIMIRVIDHKKYKTDRTIDILNKFLCRARIKNVEHTSIIIKSDTEKSESKIINNSVHNHLVTLTPNERLESFGASLNASGKECIATMSFHMGFDEFSASYWSVACTNGVRYLIQLSTDLKDKIRVLECDRLQAFTGVSCFKKLNETTSN